MSEQATKNSHWQGRVRVLMGKGFGVEDIAVDLGCDVAFVRREAAILAANGELDNLYRGWRK